MVHSVTSFSSFYNIAAIVKLTIQFAGWLVLWTCAFWVLLSSGARDAVEFVFGLGTSVPLSNLLRISAK